MTRAQGQLHIDATELFCELAVLMLRIDDKNLDAEPNGSHCDGGEEVGLACTGMAEHADVCVGVALVLERVDHDRRARRLAAANHQAAGLLNIGVKPGKESHEGAAVEDAPALEAVDGSRPARKIPVEHPESAGLQVAQDCARRRLDPLGADLQAFPRR